MSRLIQIPLGTVFGHMTVVAGPLPGNRSLYICLCECGREKVARAGALRHGTVKSCGCAFKTARPSTSKYGDRGEWNQPEYRIWVGIKSRCSNPRLNTFIHYGARGIRVCDRWLESYGHFLADMGRRPTPKHSIDRKDNDGDYSPDNCRWATRIEQQNNRPDNRWLEFSGERKTMAQWARALNIGYTRFQNHLRKNDFDVAVAVAAIRRIDSHLA